MNDVDWRARALAAEAERDAMALVVQAAEVVRDGRYSIKTALSQADRIVFDALNFTVDSYRSRKS